MHGFHVRFLVPSLSVLVFVAKHCLQTFCEHSCSPGRHAVCAVLYLCSERLLAVQEKRIITMVPGLYWLRDEKLVHAWFLHCPAGFRSSEQTRGWRSIFSLQIWVFLSRPVTQEGWAPKRGLFFPAVLLLATPCLPISIIMSHVILGYLNSVVV